MNYPNLTPEKIARDATGLFLEYRDKTEEEALGRQVWPAARAVRFVSIKDGMRSLVEASLGCVIDEVRYRHIEDELALWTQCEKEVY